MLPWFNGKWVGRVKLGICRLYPTNFLLLNPDFFFWRQRASAKAGVRNWRWGPKHAGRNRGVWGDSPSGVWGGSPKRGLGRQPQSSAPQGRFFRNWGGQRRPLCTETTGTRGRPKKIVEVKTKKLPLRKRATKTQRRPANSTGKSRRPNRGGGRDPACF